MNEPNGIHVVGVEVHDFHRLSVAEVTLMPGGRLVRVTGENRAGKTSLLRAVRAALGGAGEVAEDPRREGREDDSTPSVSLELSNGFTIRRQFTEAAPKGRLAVRGPDGGEHRQGTLNEWLGEHHDFDVLAFFSMKPDRMRDILLSAGNDPELPAKLARLKEQHTALYDERTPHIGERRALAKVEKPDGERPEVPDGSALKERADELREVENERTGCVSELARLEREEADARRVVAIVHEQLLVARQRVTELEADAEVAQGKLLAAEQLAAEAEEALPDSVAEELSAVLDQIANMAETAKALEPWTRWEDAQRRIQVATEEENALTARMDVLVAQQARLVQEAGIPVEGLSFDPDTHAPLLNGRALSDASGFERIRMAVEVAMAINPRLRICLVDEANDVDLDGLNELDRLAKQHDFQVWVCRIGLEGAGQIVVTDGEAFSQEPVGPQAVT